MFTISEEYKNILVAASRKGRLLLTASDNGEWFLEAGDLRLPQSQSALASRKIIETVRDLVRHGLLERTDRSGESGVYLVTLKGFNAAGITEGQ